MTELLKPLVVYAHLLATCIALGSILQADHCLWQSRHRQPTPSMLSQLKATQRVVSLALIALWLTGALLIGLGYMHDGNRYLLNQKLWGKVSVVGLLTLNGVLLHRMGFPLLQRTAFAAMPWGDQIRLGLLGALSATGWLFAAFLGIARHWNHVAPYHLIMSVFAAVLLTATLTVLIVVIGLRRKRSNSRSALPVGLEPDRSTALSHLSPPSGA